MTEKRCPRCKITKTLEDFPRSKHTKSGRAGWCKVCNREHSSKWRRTPSGIYTTLVAQSKYFNKGEVGFSRKEFIKWYEGQPKICVYCGVPENEMRNIGDRWNNRMRRLEIDRVDNFRPYEEGNIVLACPRCNMIKSDYFTFDEMCEIGQKYIKLRWIKALS